MSEPVACQGFSGRCGHMVASAYCSNCGRPRDGYPHLVARAFPTNFGRLISVQSKGEGIGEHGQAQSGFILGIDSAEKLLVDLQAAIDDAKGVAS